MKISGGSKGGVQIVLDFMQFFGKFGKIIVWRPLPGGLVPPPTENPGSASENKESWTERGAIVQNFTTVYVDPPLHGAYKLNDAEYITVFSYLKFSS